MTKILLLFIGLFCVQSINAQDKDQALQKLKEGKLDKAKKLIDEATRKNGDAEAYYGKALIYWNIYLSKKPEYHNLHDNPVEVSYKSYKKSIMLDDSKNITEKVKSNLQEGILVLKGDAAEYVVDEKFTSAYKTLIHASDFSVLAGITDTTLFLNIARLAQRSNDLRIAIKYYQKLVDLNYPEPETYLTLTGLYEKTRDMRNMEETMAKARSIFPQNNQIVINELNYYMEEGNLQKLEMILQEVIEANPENEIYLYTLGNIYENIGETDKAEEYYLRALQNKKGYFEANFSLGNLYLNQAIENEEESEQATIHFDKAKKYLEIAHELNPEDRNTLLSLQQLYSLTGEFDKYEKISNKIKAL